MDASSAGGEIWDAVRRSLKAPAFVLPFGTTDWHTDTQTDTHAKKTAPRAKTYRVARALFSRGRLISEASLPVFQRGWGRMLIHTTRKQDSRENKNNTIQARPRMLMLMLTC